MSPEKCVKPLTVHLRAWLKPTLPSRANLLRSLTDSVVVWYIRILSIRMDQRVHSNRNIRFRFKAVLF
jgi:hypothetical protein